ncbi:MAG: hypothetical protein IJH63_03685 [Methanobrevibacter sp.]|nr:hypothetical protein [Methanobrevibacter sp.]
MTSNTLVQVGSIKQDILEKIIVCVKVIVHIPDRKDALYVQLIVLTTIFSIVFL